VLYLLAQFFRKIYSLALRHLADPSPCTRQDEQEQVAEKQWDKVQRQAKKTNRAQQRRNFKLELGRAVLLTTTLSSLEMEEQRERQARMQMKNKVAKENRLRKWIGKCNTTMPVQREGESEEE
jgi:hypothetical protein